MGGEHDLSEFCLRDHDEDEAGNSTDDGYNLHGHVTTRTIDGNAPTQYPSGICLDDAHKAAGSLDGGGPSPGVDCAGDRRGHCDGRAKFGLDAKFTDPARRTGIVTSEEGIDRYANGDYRSGGADARPVGEASGSSTGTAQREQVTGRTIYYKAEGDDDEDEWGEKVVLLEDARDVHGLAPDGDDEFEARLAARKLQRVYFTENDEVDPAGRDSSRMGSLSVPQPHPHQREQRHKHRENCASTDGLTSRGASTGKDSEREGKVMNEGQGASRPPTMSPTTLPIHEEGNARCTTKEPGQRYLFPPPQTSLDINSDSVPEPVASYVRDEKTNNCYHGGVTGRFGLSTSTPSTDAPPGHSSGQGGGRGRGIASRRRSSGVTEEIHTTGARMTEAAIAAAVTETEAAAEVAAATVAAAAATQHRGRLGWAVAGGGGVLGPDDITPTYIYARDAVEAPFFPVSPQSRQRERRRLSGPIDLNLTNGTAFVTDPHVAHPSSAPPAARGISRTSSSRSVVAPRAPAQNIPPQESRAFAVSSKSMNARQNIHNGAKNEGGSGPASSACSRGGTGNSYTTSAKHGTSYSPPRYRATIADVQEAFERADTRVALGEKAGMGGDRAITGSVCHDAGDLSAMRTQTAGGIAPGGNTIGPRVSSHDAAETGGVESAHGRAGDSVSGGGVSAGSSNDKFSYDLGDKSEYLRGKPESLLAAAAGTKAVKSTGERTATFDDGNDYSTGGGGQEVRVHFENFA